MSPTIRSLVIPVSDLEAAKAMYGALLGSPHTDESYYVGYNINGFEVALNPSGEAGGRWPSPTLRISTRPARACSRPEPRNATRHVAPHRRRVSACCSTRTGTRSGCAESSRPLGSAASEVREAASPVR